MKNKRDNTEAAIVTALQKAGCTVHYAIREPYDVLVGRAGVNYALEIKGPHGRLTPSQNEFQATWQGHYIVVSTPEEALEAVGL